MAAVEVDDPGVQLEKRYVRPDGTVRWGWVAVAYVPGPNGEQWTMATVHDTTDRRHTEEALNNEASSDPLTGLLNRRGWRTQMRALLATRARVEPFTIAVLDFDYFKAYNDTHGHRAGDTVLQHFGSCARAVLRHDAILARWGGEEFALALPRCTNRRRHHDPQPAGRGDARRANLLRRTHHHAGRGKRRRHLGSRRHPALHRQTPRPRPHHHRPPHPVTPCRGAVHPM